MTVNRHSMPTQDAKERVNNFSEVALGYDVALAIQEAERCLNCKNAPCMSGCPVGVRIPDFIGALKKGDVHSAAKILRIDNNLASICGRVCPQENQCEKHCVRISKLGGAVAIGNLERFVGDYDLNNLENEDIYNHLDASVAVVGSGPAGLSCACELAKNGVKVKVFEALHEFGGVLEYGIPEFRLPKTIVKAQIERVKALGVEFVKNVVVGKSVFLDELLFEYDAVFIGSGAGVPQFLRIKGENFNGVYSANEFLTRVNLMRAYEKDSITPIRISKNTVVVGAGNVAMDSARTALRLHSDVRLVYRRGREEMPARKEEIAHAEEEGVKFELLTNPVEILGNENGDVVGIKCVRMALGEPDDSGRRSPIAIDGSEFVIECDQVIVALGTSPNPIISQSMPSLEIGKRGVILTDDDMRTNIARLYAGGDATTGAATVIMAMGAGKRAARAILEDMAK